MNVNRVADLGPETIRFKGTMEPADSETSLRIRLSSWEVKMLCSRVAG